MPPDRFTVASSHIGDGSAHVTTSGTSHGAHHAGTPDATPAPGTSTHGPSRDSLRDEFPSSALTGSGCPRSPQAHGRPARRRPHAANETAEHEDDTAGPRPRCQPRRWPRQTRARRLLGKEYVRAVVAFLTNDSAARVRGRLGHHRGAGSVHAGSLGVQPTSPQVIPISTERHGPGGGKTSTRSSGRREPRRCRAAAGQPQADKTASCVLLKSCGGAIGRRVGRPRSTSSVDQATFPPDDCSPRDLLPCAGTDNGYERLGGSPEALHDVVAPILAAMRDGGRPRSCRRPAAPGQEQLR